MNSILSEEKRLLILQQLDARNKLVAKHHTDVLFYKNNKKSETFRTEMLIRHSREFIELDQIYLNSLNLLEQKYIGIGVKLVDVLSRNNNTKD